ncbi:MAG: four helix bundle protein [Verrucomicrobiales bacterium]|jgi:four helix bundle protein|nr:four helix bundle protein [Verrucomicrobiales bacterium]
MTPDIKIRTFQFALRIVKLCRTLEKSKGLSNVLTRQLLKSGTSIGANVEEAHGSQSKADFTAKMYIATKEARETHYWLRLLTATELLPQDQLAGMIDEANQLVAILTTIVKKSRLKSAV